tara:strand:- start:173 stop:286 length:114 start_codon:yes stop_codon:yes gene_type:complete
MNKKIIIAVGIMVIGGVGFLVYKNIQKKKEQDAIQAS